jgi:YHS domain-containing protein
MKTAFTFAAAIFFLACSDRNNAEIFVVDGKAIRGYDAVAFHLDHKATPGNSAYTHKWKGADWQFSSQAYLDSFKLNPDKYAPQYGGYCAYGTAEGHKASTQTDTWMVKEGKLYFNYNNEVKQIWMKDQQGYIIKADKLWPKIKDDEL